MQLTFNSRTMPKQSVRVERRKVAATMTAVTSTWYARACGGF
jgi:hypothetical protein